MDLLLNLFFGRKNHDFVSGRISIEIVSSIKRVFTFFSIWKKIGKMVLNATSKNNTKKLFEYVTLTQALLGTNDCKQRYS